MAYDIDQLFLKGKKNIVSMKLIFHSDIYQSLGISNDTYYRHFSVESEAYKEMERLLMTNRVQLKAGIRNQFYNGNSAQGKLYLYKLIATPEERKILSTHNIEGNVEVQHHIKQVDVSGLSKNALLEIRQNLLAQENTEDAEYTQIEE